MYYLNSDCNLSNNVTANFTLIANVQPNNISIHQTIYNMSRTINYIHNTMPQYTRNRYSYNSNIVNQAPFIRVVIQKNAKHWWNSSDDNYKRIMAYCVYKSEFDTFEYYSTLLMHQNYVWR